MSRDTASFPTKQGLRDMAFSLVFPKHNFATNAWYIFSNLDKLELYENIMTKNQVVFSARLRDCDSNGNNNSNNSTAVTMMIVVRLSYS